MPQKVPSQAKVVIVGGGIIGCSIAYHLARLGFQDVVLLERKTLTSGTTWHAAGLLAQVRPSENQTRLLEYAAHLYRNIEAETGQSAGFVGKSTIYLALNEARLHFLKQTIGYAQYLGVSGAKLLAPQEIAERWPLLNLDGVAGGSFMPATGQLNPVDATQAFAKGARLNGASVIEHAKVLDIIVRDGVVVGVETEHGTIEAGIVVLAGGLWTRDLVAKHGINIPLHAAEHFYIVSDPIPSLSQTTPSLFCADERAYYKEDAGKLLIGTFEKHAVPWATDGIPEDSEYETLPNDLDRYAEFLELASGRVPALDKVGIRTFFTGPESFTPDGRELMGETPEVRNLYVCAGFNSHGIMAAPGSGKVMAQWIRDRNPPMAMSGYDVTRMMPFQRARRYLFERTQETMGYVMDIPWPGKFMQSARGVRRFPMHRELLSAGAVFGERYGWEAPLWYSQGGARFDYKIGRQDWYPQVAEECLATRDAVALYDQSNYSRYLVQGKDACRALDYLCANDVDVEPGKVVYSQWLNERGGIEADITAIRLADDKYMLVSAPPSMVRDVYWFRKHIPADWNATIADVTAGYAMFGIMGPKSREMLQQLTDVDLSHAAFPFATSRDIDLGCAVVRATRLTYVGELGYELLVTTDMAAYVYHALIEAGAAYDMRHAGSYALGACRLERAYRHFGHDITEDQTPIEAGLSFAVAWRKSGDFLGRKALEAARGVGVPQKRLVTLRLEDTSEAAPILAHNEVIWRNGERVGYVTSGGWGFRIGASLAMGYVKNPSGVDADWIESGTYEVEVALRKYPARVQLKPFYDPKGERIRM